MNTQIKISDTRFPRLAGAVVRRVGRKSLEDIVNYGIKGGFSGFIYYSETIAFFHAHRRQIMELAAQTADEFGQDMLEIIAGFNCLKGDKLTPYEVSEALNGKGESAGTVKNAMAWFAAEEIARELNPDL